MEDTVVLYTSPMHLNSTSILARLINKHHPTIPVIILSSAPESAAASVAVPPSITYRSLPAVTLPPNLTKNPVELMFEIPRLNNPDLGEVLQKISEKSRIKAFVIDFFCNAAFEVSTSLNIPTYFDVSNGAFGLCVFFYLPTMEETFDSDIGELNEYIEIPGCPLIHSSDLPKAMHFRQSNIYKHFVCTAENMRRASGIVVNSFDALELRAKEAITNGLCVPNAPTPPVYFLGPLVGEIDVGVEHDCLKWLDKQPRKSVIFLCFGRMGFFSSEQIKEMAIGLENSGHRFLWSVRDPPGNNNGGGEPNLDDLLPEGFLERNKERGFVIKSWAPQKEVLSHDSVAGFVTHCGRSSVLEAVSFGVPMIAWPMYAEQRMNRIFMVEEMRIALELEEADGMEAGGVDEAVKFVTAVELEKRIRELMELKTGRDASRRVTEMKHAAKAALGHNGSTRLALQNFLYRLGDSGE